MSAICDSFLDTDLEELLSGVKRPRPADTETETAAQPPAKRKRLAPPGVKETKKDFELRLQQLGVKVPSGLLRDELKLYLEAVEKSIEMGTLNPADTHKKPQYPMPPVKQFDRSRLNWDPEETGLQIMDTGDVDPLDFFGKNGYLVVKLMDAEKAREFNLEIRDWVQQLGPECDLNNSKTLDKLPPTMHGIFKCGAQSELMWKLRTMPSVIKLFQFLYNTSSALVASFDAFNVSFPLVHKTNLAEGEKMPEQKCWAHSDRPNPALFTPIKTDQDLQRAETRSYQMCVNLSKAKAGTILWLGDKNVKEDSAYKRLIKQQPHRYFGWEKIDPKLIVDAEGNPLEATQFILEPGEAVVWVDDLFHQGSSPLLMDPEAESLWDSARVAAYVSFVPRWLLTDEELEKRKNWFEKGYNTGHWCYGPWLKTAFPPMHHNKMKVTPMTQMPRLDLKTIKDETLKALKPLIEQLIGY